MVISFMVLVLIVDRMLSFAESLTDFLQMALFLSPVID